MTMFVVKLGDFILQKQEGHAWCWACAVISLLWYHKKIEVPNQAGLVQQYGRKHGARPEEVLKDKYNLPWTHTVTYAKAAAAEADVKAREKSVGDFLEAHLKNGPILAELTERSDNKWDLKPDKDGNPQKPYLMRHAVMIFRYENAQHRLGFADPAQGNVGGHAKHVSVSLNKFTTGFHYTDSSSFGPQTIDKFAPGALPDQVYLRVMTMWSFG